MTELHFPLGNQDQGIERIHIVKWDTHMGPSLQCPHLTCVSVSVSHMLFCSKRNAVTPSVYSANAPWKGALLEKDMNYRHLQSCAA